MDARKARLGEKDALDLVKQASRLYVAKGKRLTQIDLKKEKPSRAELLKLMLGPTGNLRAPVLRRGKTLVVGFHEDAYRQVFG